MPDTLTANHWGAAVATARGDTVASVRDHAADPAGSALNRNIASSLSGRARILRPAVRASWLAHGPGAATDRRGREPFVEVSWDRLLDLLAAELTRVREDYGNDGLFAGSYGWASAGRFHHAQSQLKRFLNCIGGFVASRGNYSYETALQFMPYVVGDFRQHVKETTRWTVVAQHSDLVVSFGGLPMRNTEISDGGMSKHRARSTLQACKNAGVSFINVSPLRGDIDADIGAEWLAPKPGTDTALMMGIAHTLLVEELHDTAFLARYTVGWDKVEAYLRGAPDGVSKSATWAAEQCGIPAHRIAQLAREMASQRTMITTAAGLQRADRGEQPLWMTVTLAAMLGQIGLPGGGYTIAYAVNGNIGQINRPFRAGHLPQGDNPVANWIPVAMISEMLLKPGAEYRFNGTTRRFPDTKLVWWAGGNPFHHHQDLNRLREAFARPETIVVNEINWTATARHADIVLPVAAATERWDFAAGQSDNALIPMPRAVAPPGDARVEYDIYTDLAERFGVHDAFTEGRSETDWLHRLWDTTRAMASDHDVDLPDWDDFIAGDLVSLPDPAPDQVFLAGFRADPVAHALPTPSGRIELYSETLAGYALDDCPAQATWFPPAQGDADGPLSLLSGQPATRLHSQHDNGAWSVQHKIQGREPLRIHPADAAERGIADGDIVELFNAQGRCLAGAQLDDGIRPGCVFLWTGAWYDPDFDAPQDRDRHGNPNVLTRDLRASSLSQGPAAHGVRVDVQRFEGPVPAVRAFDPPPLQPPTNTQAKGSA
ncbi:MAG: molybdopterin-dependent oxidoreductase [Pseudomonadota bacterium]